MAANRHIPKDAFQGSYHSEEHDIRSISCMLLHCVRAPALTANVFDGFMLQIRSDSYEPVPTKPLSAELLDDMVKAVMRRRS